MVKQLFSSFHLEKGFVLKASRALAVSSISLVFLITSLPSFAMEQKDILNDIEKILMKENKDPYGFETLHSETIQYIEPTYISQPAKKRTVQDSELPLFTETCDNIAYSGVVENQVIGILEDTRSFIEGVTDPVVNINKFEAGMFLYALGKCLSEETKKRFSTDCDATVSNGETTQSADVGTVCFVDNFMESIGNTDDVMSVTVGEQASTNNSTGTVVNADAQESQASNIVARSVLGMINKGWFDQTAKCVYKEKQEILTKLHTLFERNYRVKTSLINSINNVCNVSLRKEGDYSTWDEIFEAQAKLMGKEELGIMNLITESEQTASVNQKLKEFGFDTCIDGFSVDGGCLTKEQEKKLSELSKLVEYNNENYNPQRAYDITRHFFDDQNTLKEEYATSAIFSSIITKTVPTICSEQGCSQVSINSILAPTAKFELDFRQLKDTFNIKPNTDLGVYLDDIFYDIFPRMASVSSLGLMAEEGLQDISLPLQNPFDTELLQEGAPENDRFIVMKTLTNRALTIGNKHSTVERSRIADFYRKVVEALFISQGNKEEIAPYKIAHVVSDANYDTFLAAIQKLAVDNSKMGMLIGSKNAISDYASRNRANKELAAIQIFSWMEILKTIFQTNAQPGVYFEVTNSLDYEITSKVKEYTIPLNFNHDRDFVKIRRFFQALSIKLSDNDTANILDIRAMDVEDMVSTKVSERELVQMAKAPSADEVMDYINRIQKKSDILNARLINYPE